MFRKNKQLVLGMEYVPEGEESAMREIVELSLQEMNLARRPVPRGQHGKSHGCVRARFKVCADIRDEFRHGLFKTARSYDALIRFSNNEKFDDAQSDPRGMAVKLFQNDDPIQDFLMIDHPVFFIRNVADYVIFVRAFVASRQSKIVKKLSRLPKPIKALVGFIILFIRFYRNHWKELRISWKLNQQTSSKRP